MPDCTMIYFKNKSFDKQLKTVKEQLKNVDRNGKKRCIQIYIKHSQNILHRECKDNEREKEKKTDFIYHL